MQQIGHGPREDGANSLSYILREEFCYGDGE